MKQTHRTSNCDFLCETVCIDMYMYMFPVTTVTTTDWIIIIYIIYLYMDFIVTHSIESMWETGT